MNPSTATTERAPNPILGMLGRGLEATLNRVLSLDPETLDALRALDDRSITIAFKGSALAMRIAVDSGQLRVGPAFAGDSQLRVSATPVACWQWRRRDCVGMPMPLCHRARWRFPATPIWRGA